MARRHFPPKGSTAAWAAALRKAALDQETSGPNKGRKRLDIIAERVVELALAGDMAATRELADRLDGKAPQQLALTGAEGEGPVRMEVCWVGELPKV